MAKYSYRPLLEDEIRLIELLPGSQDRPLRMRLIHHVLKTAPTKTDSSKPLEHNVLPPEWQAHRTPEGKQFFIDYSKPPSDRVPVYNYPGAADGEDEDHELLTSDAPTTINFEALSYVWGSSEKVDSISVVEETSDGNHIAPTIPIAANHAIVLKALRSTTAPRRLWIDALSINQSDNVERAEQVARMGLIYGTASRVVVWLGRGDDETALAMRTLRAIGEQVEISEDRRLFASANTVPDDAVLPSDLGVAEQGVLQHLFTRSWFNRVWTMQEIALANPDAIVKCGEHEMKFYYLRRAIAALLVQRSKLCTKLRVTVEGLRTLAYGPAGGNVIEVLETMLSRRCSDPRDKIYGCMNMVGPMLAREIHPSYDISVAEVYKDAFLKCSTLTRRLDLLDYCSAARFESDVGAPSWVPNWLIGPDSILPLPLGFLASGLSPAVFTSAGDILQVMGVQCGTVSVVNHPRPGATIFERMQDFESKAGDMSHFAQAESRADAWIRLLSRGCTQERFPGHSFSAIKPAKARLAAVLDGTAPASLRDAMSNNLNHINTSISFFTLSSGAAGLGLGDIQPGDCVQVFLGCGIPMILRPKPSSQLEIIGRCFVAGSMDGEALLGSFPTPWRIQHGTPPTAHRPLYLHEGTGQTYVDDPRLEPLPDDWERINGKWTRDHPIFMDFFRKKSTGEVQYHDPRMSAEALKARGVPLEVFELV